MILSLLLGAISIMGYVIAQNVIENVYFMNLCKEKLFIKALSGFIIAFLTFIFGGAEIVVAIQKLFDMYDIIMLLQ